MIPSISEKRQMASFKLGSSNQHRRRISTPSTPPETPMDGFFGGDSGKTTTTHTRGNSVFPLSPPPTPVKTLLSEKEPVLPLSSSSHKRQPSHAYAHHRRTSTSTLLRLAAAKQGLNLTPQKAAALFLIIFSATYLATFLPGPLSLMLPRPPSRAHYIPADGLYAVKSPSTSQAATAPVGDAAERHAWAESLHERIPPHQRVVPSSPEAVVAAALAADVDEEGIARLAQQGGRRRPLRLAKQQPANDFKVAAAAEPIPVENDFFDDAPRSPPRREQPARMKKVTKVSAAKGQNARVGVVPVDSSKQAQQARLEQDRVILEAAGSAGRRKLRNPKGAVAAVVAAAAEHEAAAKVKEGRPHAAVAAVASTALDEEKTASDASRHVEEPVKPKEVKLAGQTAEIDNEEGLFIKTAQ